MFTLISPPGQCSVRHFIACDKKHIHLHCSRSHWAALMPCFVFGLVVCWQSIRWRIQLIFCAEFQSRLLSNGFHSAGPRVWLGAPCCCGHLLHWKVDGEHPHLEKQSFWDWAKLRIFGFFRGLKLAVRGRLLGCPTRICTVRSNHCSTATRELTR